MMLWWTGFSRSYIFNSIWWAELLIYYVFLNM